MYKFFTFALFALIFLATTSPSEAAIRESRARNEHMRYCLSKGGEKEICLCSFEKSLVIMSIDDLVDLNRKLSAGMQADPDHVSRLSNATEECVEDDRDAKYKKVQDFVEGTTYAPPPPPPSVPKPPKLGDRNSGLISGLKADPVRPKAGPNDLSKEPVAGATKSSSKSKRKYYAPVQTDFGEYNKIFFDTVAEGDLKGLVALTQHVTNMNITDTNGNTPLIHSAMFGQPKSTKFLLSKRAKVSTKNHQGQTALHIASFSRRADIVEVLLQSKANPNESYGTGFTPLILATMQQDEASMMKLISRGAKIGTKMNDGNTALHIAATTDNANVIQLIANAGADLNAYNNSGQTPLMVAAQQNKPSSAQTLLNLGSNYNLPDAYGRTAAAIANSLGNGQVMNVILTHEQRMKMQNYSRR